MPDGSPYRREGHGLLQVFALVQARPVRERKHEARGAQPRHDQKHPEIPHYLHGASGQQRADPGTQGERNGKRRHRPTSALRVGSFHGER